ncbi:MAG: type VI secretion system contractile sheath large subunit [Rhodospirillaceae bacterium]
MFETPEAAHQAAASSVPGRSDESARARLREHADRLIAAIDRALTEQVNAILHHPEFQRLEASWRSLRYLVDASGDIDHSKVRVLPISWKELARDLTRSVDFDETRLFDKIYNQEFGMPGGEPYGVLIGDYEVSPLPVAGQPDAVAVLREMAKVSAAAFAPFICGAAPAMFGLDHFREMGVPIDLGAVFRQTEYQRWRDFQRNQASNDDLRFIGLTLPRMLIREPLADNGSRRDGFRFRENSGRDSRHGCLWSPAAFAFASVILRAFGECGWFSDIRGARRDILGGGLVVDLPVPSFATDRPGIAIKLSTDVELSDNQERELSELGFIPLSKARYTDYSVFFSNQSIQIPQKYDETTATVNARLSSMMQYLLCISRFAHHIKVMCRDRLGSFSTPAEAEDFLNRWLVDHCVDNDDASDAVKARYPLKRASVEVRELPGRPGIYACNLWLQPHFQLDEISAGFRLVTEVATGQAA